MEDNSGRIVLCGANAYEKKYYFNEKFNGIPESIKEELHIICVLFTEEVGGVFTIVFEEDGSVETYKIVTTVRGDSLHNLISIESPLGKALMRHREGDRVEVKVNDNYSYFVTIQKIENTKDDDDDRIRSY